MIAIIIPTLDPEQALLRIADELLTSGVDKLLIVDDGSCAACTPIFDALKEKPRCTVLHHARNLGKGRALKTAFNHLLVNEKDCRGAVTADADGQHSVRDILAVAEKLKTSGEEVPFVLGVRDFSEPGVPWKSRFGNRTSRALFRWLAHIDVQDTQTGLRGISRDFMLLLLDAQGERFDFESTMLIKAGKKAIPVQQLTIETIYLDGNRATHFHPLRDSWQIFKVLFGQTFATFMLFAGSGLTAFAIDIGIFSLMFKWLIPCVDKFAPGEIPYQVHLLLSVISARVVSSICNYLLNRNVVFKYSNSVNGKEAEKNSDIRSLLLYYLLCIGVLAGSYFFTMWAVKLTGIGEVKCKIVVDALLFLTSFSLQKLLIFRHSGEE